MEYLLPFLGCVLLIIVGLRIRTATTAVTAQKSVPGFEEELRYIANEEKITVQGHELTAFHLYVGHIQNWHEGPKSLLDIREKVASGIEDKAGNEMNYWPSYRSIPPECRLAYINWLNGGRRDPEYGIGYVFLYFYGLEYRLFCEGIWKDAAPILAEVEALQKTYDNHSFQRYSRNFLDMARLIMNPAAALAHYEPMPEQMRPVPFQLRAAIGKSLDETGVISADLAFDWWMCALDKNLPRIVLRVFPELRKLFNARFEAQYPTGMRIALPKTQFRDTYHSASGEVSYEITLAIPDIRNLTAPLNKIGDIADGCVQELEQFSRALGKVQEATCPIAAYAELPEELRAGADCPAGRTLEEWIAGAVHQPGFLSVKLVAEMAGVPLDGKITKIKIRQIADILSGFDIGLEPYHGTGLMPGINDHLYLFRVPRSDRSFHPGKSYSDAAALLALFASIAAADGTIDDAEAIMMTTLSAKLGSGLSQLERSRLQTLVEWLKKHPPGWQKVRGQLKAVSSDQKDQICRLGLAAAAADGHIAPQEVKLLEKLYDLLEMDRTSLYGQLHADSEGNNNAMYDGPVTVASADPVIGYPVPRRPVEATGMIIDMEKVRLIRQESQDISQILSTIFTVEDDAMSMATQIPEAGLPPPYAAILQVLTRQSSWEQAAYKALCAQHGCMPGGAMETINEWFFDEYGDALLEDGDPIIVNIHLMEGKAA